MKVNFTETVLRDANQSLIATRMPFEAFEGILPRLSQIPCRSRFQKIPLLSLVKR